ncbi:hypothetical protein GCM10028798_24230 [Humibacter antri]
MTLKRTMTLVLPAFAAVLALMAASPAVAQPAGPIAGPDSHRGDLSVKDVTFLGPLDQNAHVVARDNGQSVLYRGKSYWFFDDTQVRNPDGFLSSTAAVTSDLDASNGITLHSTDPFDEQNTGSPTEFVPYSAAETAFQEAHASTNCTGSTDPYCGTQFAFWPGAAVADPARHRILVFYGKLCRGGPANGPCASGFVGQPLGNGIVSVDMSTHQISRLAIEHQDPALTSPEGHDPTQLFPSTQNWGSNGLVLHGRELYAYGGCSNTNACGVARVPVDRVQDRSAWRFYTGNANPRLAWSSDPAAAVAVMTGGAAGETVHFDPSTGLYTNTFMPFLSDQVQFQTAQHPWGPWSTPKLLFATPRTSGVEYAAFAHPEYTTNHGLTRYFTYYTSSTGAQMLVKVDFTRS